MGTTYARSQLFGLFYPAKDEPSWLHTPFQPLGSRPNTCIPASSPCKYIWPTSYRAVTSFTCTFGKTQYTSKRRLRNSLRFKTATFMPWTLLTGILTSSKKRLQMIHQRLFSYKMTRDTYSTSKNWKKTMRAWGWYLNIVSQSMLRYRSLDLLHNSLCWVQILVLYLGLFCHREYAKKQGDLAAGHQWQPLPCPCGSTGQLTLHIAAKVMGIGSRKTPKVREIFLSSLIRKESGSP